MFPFLYHPVQSTWKKTLLEQAYQGFPGEIPRIKDIADLKKASFYSALRLKDKNFVVNSAAKIHYLLLQ